MIAQVDLCDPFPRIDRLQVAGGGQAVDEGAEGQRTTVAGKDGDGRGDGPEEGRRVQRLVRAAIQREGGTKPDVVDAAFPSEKGIQMGPTEEAKDAWRLEGFDTVGPQPRVTGDPSSQLAF